MLAIRVGIDRVYTRYSTLSGSALIKKQQKQPKIKLEIKVCNKTRKTKKPTLLRIDLLSHIKILNLILFPSSVIVFSKQKPIP